MRLRLIFILGVLWGCSLDHDRTSSLFTNITQQSGVDFHNDLHFTEQLNPYTYRNFYNGAGVAIGDINNDGLLDIYFAGNQVDNKLYLNQGNFQFTDISEAAGVASKGVWSTGVTFADINADGLLDIYVCKSGNPDTPNRHNELFINNGDLTFSEKSKEYGLDVIGLSVQAAFFDFDKDGDLDCYLLTNSFKSVGNYDLVKDQRAIPDPQNGGNKFFINENGKFRDYSEKANIYRSNIGFGLGITLGDFNTDGWIDIFVSNDFFERDYLYINDQHGSFTESLTDYFESISMGSMGADFADLDNDGDPELFVTEMLPDSLNRKKSKMVYENWNKYELNIKNGYHHQFARNVLQKKTGDNDYVEIGRLSGMAASEWSWGALLFDMNNDGLKDVFIANGIYKDLLDRDYLTYTGARDNIRKIIKEEKNAIVKLIDLMPSSSFQNYAFCNDGNFIFKNQSIAWGLSEPMYSSGSAYGDLDNDGDLDLVINNINGSSIVYKNNTDSSAFKSISIALRSNSKNTFAVGSQVVAYCGTKTYMADNFVTRGYQSCMQPDITIGLGEEVTVIDSLLIKWPDNLNTILYSIPVNQKLHVVKEDSKNKNEVVSKKPKAAGNFRLTPVHDALYKHIGNGLIDFNRDRLLPTMYSNETPFMLKGDIDSDGIEEIYIGGGKNQSGAFIHLAIDNPNSASVEYFRNFDLAEETNGALFDVDGDDDLDFYMSTGGRFFPNISEAQVDKIFLNNGKGVFTESPYPLPLAAFSTSVAMPIDFDKDGDLDLLVGERFDPFVYGHGGGGFLLENDGKGLFRNVTQKYAPDLMNIGMITDATIVDVDNDGWEDMVLVGDWMPITILKNNKGNFSNVSAEFGLTGTEGWWHDIETADLNNDGKPDFVIGNQGLNSFFKSGDRMYVNDFDNNGSKEQIFCTLVNDKYFPIADKDEFLSQLPTFRKSLLYYRDYAKKSIDELFPKDVLNSSKIYQVNKLSSLMLLSKVKGYDIIELPLQAQFSSIYSLLIGDFDHDGTYDLIAGGNQYLVKPQFGRQDASHGWFFKGAMNENQFTFRHGENLHVSGQIRDIEFIEVRGTKFILFTKYNDQLEIFKIPN